jgi:hypothetical protein
MVKMELIYLKRIRHSDGNQETKLNISTPFLLVCAAVVAVAITLILV